MVLTFSRYLFLLAFCVLVTGVLGTGEAMAEESSRSWLLRGNELSERGQYQEAARAFQQAVQVDPASEIAYLSLGNSHYELGSYAAATDAFQHVLQINPANGTAMFYLGLSLVQQKKYAESIPYFEKAGALDSDFQQLSLFYIGEAQSELGNLQEASDTWQRAIKVNPSTDIARKTGTLIKKLTQKESKKPWSVSMSAGIEYDDNITVSLQDLATGLDDFANIFEFSGAYKFFQTPKFELEAGYDFYQSLYLDLSEFDLQSHIFSLGGSRKFENFDIDVFTSYNRSTLGGEDFMDTFSVAPQIGFFPAERWFALIGYSYENFQFFNDPTRDGGSHSLGMDHFVFFMEGKSYLLFSYRVESKNTRADEFTYVGHYGTVGVKVPLPFWNQKGAFNLSYRYFYKDYSEITPSLGRERRDLRHTLGVKLTQPLSKCLTLNLNYEFIDSVSNLQQIDFTENIASLAFAVSF
jgi:tetratricopeptide (TPR) repeat protein